MQTPVLPDQKILVINKGDETAHQCVVLSVRARQGRVFDVGFEFPASTPQLWQSLETHSENPVFVGPVGVRIQPME